MRDLEKHFMVSEILLFLSLLFSNVSGAVPAVEKPKINERPIIGKFEKIHGIFNDNFIYAAKQVLCINIYIFIFLLIYLCNSSSQLRLIQRRKFIN